MIGAGGNRLNICMTTNGNDWWRSEKLSRMPFFRAAIFAFIFAFGNLLICSPALSQTSETPQFIKVDLSMQGITYGHKDGSSVTNARQWTASVIIGSNTWRMESEFAANASDFRYCDGTNVYYATDIHSLPEGPTAFKVANSLGPNRNVVVIPGTHPMGDFNANLVWLAYCSGDYLRSTNRLLPLPGSEVRHDLSAFAVKDSTVLSEAAPYLPKRVEFLLDKSNVLKAQNSLFVFRSVNRPMPPLPGTNGMLWGVYQAEGFTNFAGHSIPMAFSYTQYNRPMGVEGSEMRYLMSGKITAITGTTAPKPLLEDGKEHYIEDTRLRDPVRLVDSVRYLWTNAILPATNDPMILERLGKASQKAPLAR